MTAHDVVFSELSTRGDTRESYADKTTRADMASCPRGRSPILRLQLDVDLDRRDALQELLELLLDDRPRTLRSGVCCSTPRALESGRRLRNGPNDPGSTAGRALGLFLHRSRPPLPK